MIRAGAIRARGTWDGDVRDAVVLGFDDRHRRRLVMCGVRGTAFLLDLPEAIALRGGDALLLDDGALIEVVAAPEPLVEISAPDASRMVRIAWHLGNRHLPVQIAGKRLRIRKDHVIEAMVEGLGGQLRAIQAPFDPEGGAYSGPDVSAHHHPHDHPHDHGHGHHHDRHG